MSAKLYAMRVSQSRTAGHNNSSKLCVYINAEWLWLKLHKVRLSSFLEIIV